MCSATVYNIEFESFSTILFQGLQDHNVFYVTVRDSIEYLYCRQRSFLPKFQALSPKQEDVTERRKPFGRRCSKFTGDRVRYLEEFQPHMAMQDCLYICIS
jgi:hypothetical protein